MVKIGETTCFDIAVTLEDNHFNDNVVNHYNALNQLIQTMIKNHKVSITYDAEGLRTSKTVNWDKTVFVWDGDQLVIELSESGKGKKRYICGNHHVYAIKERTPKNSIMIQSGCSGIGREAVCKNRKKSH